MRSFNYSIIKNKKWDSEVLGLVASIYRYQGKQEIYLKAAVFSKKLYLRMKIW